MPTHPTTRQLLCALALAPLAGLALVVALPFLGWAALAAAAWDKVRRAPLHVVGESSHPKG